MRENWVPGDGGFFFDEDPREPQEIVDSLFEMAKLSEPHTLVVHNGNAGVEWIQGVNSEGNKVMLIRPDEEHKRYFRLSGLRGISYIAAIVHVERPSKNPWIKFTTKGVVEKKVATFGLLVTGETFWLEVKEDKLVYTSIDPEVFVNHLNGEFLAFAQE